VLARDLHFEVPISFLILDESQYIKKIKLKIFKAINQIKTTHNLVAYRKLIRRFVVSNAIYQSEYFGSYAFFAEHYKVPIEKQDENSLLELKKT
jgi:non-specific serine/threonine protein kinase